MNGCVGWVGELIDRRMNGGRMCSVGGWVNGWMYQRTNGWMDVLGE